MTDLLDEDVLRRLARPTGDVAPRPPETVRARAVRITRRRRRGAAVAATAAAGVAVAVLLPLMRPATVRQEPAGPPPTSVATSSARTPCQDSESTLALDATTDLLWVADRALTGPRRGPVFPTRVTRCLPPDGTAVTTTSLTQYFGRTQVDLGGDVWVIVSRVVPQRSRPSPVDARPVTVLPGVTGFWQPLDADSDARGALTWERDGLDFLVGGEVGLAKALRIARTLTPTDPADPRLQ